MEMGIVDRMLKNLIKKPITVRFPWESIEIPEGYRGEHVFDINKCISCSLCARVCPNRAIEMVEVPEEHRDRYPKRYPKIDLGKCCFCALCQDICPKGAIQLTKNVYLSVFDKNAVVKAPLKKEEAKT